MPTGRLFLTAVEARRQVVARVPGEALLGLAGFELRYRRQGSVWRSPGRARRPGTWQYRLAKTKDFLPIDPVSPVFALLLRPTDQLRFVPAANANGQGDLTFKVWVPDANFGDVRGYDRVRRDSGVAVIPIKAVNDAPVLDLVAPTGSRDGSRRRNEHRVDGRCPAGDTAGPGDPCRHGDPGHPVVAGECSCRQVAYFDGVEWKDVKVAKRLAADVQIRFQAAAGAAAGEVNLAFKLWDGKLLSKLKGEVTVTIG